MLTFLFDCDIILVYSRNVIKGGEAMLRLRSPKAIGDILRECRMKKNQSLTCAANGIGITPSALSNYENGIRIPRDETKASISNYYGLPLSDIFFERVPTNRE